MKLQIVLAMALMSGMVAVGCSDSDDSGSGGGGLVCQSSYSVPLTLLERTADSIVEGGGGKFCGVSGATATFSFIIPPAQARQFTLTTTSPLECEGEETFFYTYSYDGPLGQLALFQPNADTGDSEYVGMMTICQTSVEGGEYEINLYDDANSWQRGAYTYTN